MSASPDLIEASHGYGEDSYVMLHVSDPGTGPCIEPYTVADVRKIIDDAELDGDAFLRIKLDEAALDNREPMGGWYVTRTAVGLPEGASEPALKLLVDNGPLLT